MDVRDTIDRLTTIGPGEFDEINPMERWEMLQAVICHCSDMEQRSNNLSEENLTIMAQVCTSKAIEKKFQLMKQIIQVLWEAQMHTDDLDEMTRRKLERLLQDIRVILTFG